MAAITPLSADFEGTDGATATAAAIGATQLTGGGTFTFSGTDPKQGSTDLQLSATASTAIVRWDFTSVTTFWDDIYLKVPASAPAATLTIANWLDSTGTLTIGALRLNTDLTLTLRDGTVGVWTSPSPLTPNTWFRFSVKAVPGSATGHRCRVYTSAGGNAISPDMDSGDQACTAAGAANVGSWRVGICSSSTTTLHIDRNRADNATEPAGLTAGLPPTVNAGPDLTKEVGSGTFTITASVTPGSGTTIVSRSWTRLSGDTVTLSGQTTDTVTVTAPLSTTGTTTLRYTATQSDGQSSTDDVVLTWVAVGRTLYPASDVSNSGWQNQAGNSINMFASIDDVVLDTSDFIAASLGAVPAVYRPRLPGQPAPTNTSGWYVPINARVTPDATTCSLTVKLYEADGTTLRKAWAPITTLTTTSTEYQLTLTSGEIAAITTWATGLILEITATGS